MAPASLPVHAGGNRSVVSRAPDGRRATGAYYTPPDAARWMAEWVVAGDGQVVLEPSCGDGAFVAAVSEVAAGRGIRVAVHAVEADVDALKQVAGGNVVAYHSDFHAVSPFPVDAVIGNPPFVRLRNVAGVEARDAAVTAARAALGGRGIDLSASVWATIVLHATMFLKPGGRAAFVLPADSLHLGYARPVWEHLASRFGRLRVVRCRERVFPGILQDVVILLADRHGGSTSTIRSELYTTRAGLTGGQRPERRTVRVVDLVGGGRPFTRALLGDRPELELLEARTVRADTYLKFHVGYLDADKTFFHPDPATRDRFGFPARHLRPALKNGRSMAGAGFRSSSVPDRAVHRLWLPDPARLSPGEQAYIVYGETRGVHQGFKTRNRTPWYLVPDVKVPGVVVSVFSDLPRLLVNDTGLVASNSLLLGFWQDRALGGRDTADRFALCWYSSVTRLGVELAARSLGGGVLNITPREADRVRMPALPDIQAPGCLLRDLDTALAANNLEAAYRVGDTYLRTAGWGLSELRGANDMADTLLGWRRRR